MVLPDLPRLGLRAAAEAQGLAYVLRSGLVGPVTPNGGLRLARGLKDYGSIGAAPVIAAVRHGSRTGLVDDLGRLSFAELDARSDALAHALAGRGLKAGDGIGVLCRNHRGFLDITFAGAKLGAKLLFLNTDFSGPQLREVCGREGIELLVHDEEFAAVAEGVDTPLGHLRAWTEEPGEETLEALIAGGQGGRVPAPESHAKIIILTSGTTGTPKGAQRSEPSSLTPFGALLSKAPFRAREATYVAPPLFHGLGLAHAMLAVALGSTIVVSRRFKAPDVLAAVERERCTAIIAVPVMLSRLVSAAEASHPDLSLLRIVFVAGSQLDASLATRSLDALGETIYNLYGSTEVAYATIATPEDLRAAPGCAGRPPMATTVRLYDDEGVEVKAAGKTGRIFVGNSFPFEGYTDGRTKAVIDGLMSSGDVGHFDQAGRLFIDGRDDDMIVSGGENLYPGEVEDLLSGHPEIEECAVLGVDDADWGKRLAAFVVRRDGAELDEQQIKDYVRDNLARFKSPRDVTFMDELPRNPTGKVLKRELLKHGASA
ncbi:MAG: acyl-CoA synthetase [Solirubrobacterales bacterium]|nr:acyl-CoA synthetase [Solirubrobacterales bacterium]